MAANGRPQKWRDLPPVERAVSIAAVEGIRRVRTTFLREHDRCDRAAYLDLLHEGGVGSHEMNRGSIFHVAMAKCIRHVIAHEEHQFTPETAKDMLRLAYAEEPHLTVPNDERDALRGMMHNAAQGTYWTNPAVEIVAVEMPLRLRLGEWLVTGKPDLIEQPYYGRLDVTDWKTTFAKPPAGEWRGDFQTKLYSLLAAFGETEDGLVLGADAQRFGLKLGFPRYLRDDGLAFAFHEIDRQELVDLRFDLEDQLARLAASLDSQEWPATPGSHCSECVSPNECPLPRHLRPDSQLHHDSTIEEAVKLAEWWEMIAGPGGAARRVKARLKRWADQHGRRSIPIGTDLELAFEQREKHLPMDREQLLAEVEGAVEYGHPIDIERHRETRTETAFVRRRVKETE